jgi:hypothetical protein
MDFSGTLLATVIILILLMAPRVLTSPQERGECENCEFSMNGNPSDSTPCLGCVARKKKEDEEEESIATERGSN